MKEIIGKAYERSTKILNENIEGLNKLADLLLEREVIFSEDLENIFGPRKSHSRAEVVTKGFEENGNDTTSA